MSTSLLRVVERAQQDAEQGPEAIQSNGLRRVSAPPTPTGRGPARSAHETLGRTLQLLRSERQPSKSGPSGSRHATGLATAPSQPAHASHVGAVQPIVGTLPASPAAGCRADMGGVATRHISGGAGWWKSPCPVLVRASGEQSPGATRPYSHFGFYRPVTVALQYILLPCFLFIGNPLGQPFTCNLRSTSHKVETGKNDISCGFVYNFRCIVAFETRNADFPI